MRTWASWRDFWAYLEARPGRLRRETRIDTRLTGYNGLWYLYGVTPTCRESAGTAREAQNRRTPNNRGRERGEGRAWSGKASSCQP